MADDIKGNEAAAQSLEIRTLLKAMMQYGASDLHLVVVHHLSFVLMAVYGSCGLIS